MSRETAVRAGIPIYPNAAAVRRKHPNKCQQDEKKSEVRTCDYGTVEGARKTIALIGGSHSEHWLPALEQLGREHRWKIVAITKSACPFITDTRRHPSCIAWQEAVYDVLAQVRPDAVFTIASRRNWSAAPGEPVEEIPDSYLEHWVRLAKQNITVIAIRDTPRMRDGVLECLEKHADDIAQCARPREETIDAMDPTSRLQPKPDNVSFVDLSDRFCDSTLCYPVGGNVLAYRDVHHITIQYARTLAAPLGERIREVRPDLFAVEKEGSDS